MTAEALTFDDLGIPLSQATFVVIDLETTGTKPDGEGITEIGAVKVRGGEVLGEFRTFVDPGTPIPPFISVLTGITDAHVAGAPRINAALPMLLEFAGFAGRDASLPILVAHNAGFDVGFLKAACRHVGSPWPNPFVLDTVVLARRILRNSEVRNHKLATLARYFHATVAPTHRALDDARATVDVLHGLIERVGNLGVHDVESLVTFDGSHTERRRRKRHLAQSVPESPGVYIFHDAAGRPLYVGVSRNMRRRVMSYFTAAEQRRRMTAMVELADSVTPVVCGTELEARVRELRLIAEHRPRFNVRSRNPERTAWVSLTTDTFPRLSVIRHGHLATGARTTIGPFRSAAHAQLAVDALHETFNLRQCTQRITRPGSASSCALADMGRCCAPCVDPDAVAPYAEQVRAATAAMVGDSGPIAEALTARIADLSAQLRYEEAAVTRDRWHAASDGIHRAAALRALCRIPELVAAAPTAGGGWDIHVIRHGWLAAAAHAPTADTARSVAEAAQAAAATYLEPALTAETEMVLRWLHTPGTRLIDVTDGHAWSMPVAACDYASLLANVVLTSANAAKTDAAAPESMESEVSGNADRNRAENESWGEP